jgi:hypothetical protein
MSQRTSGWSREFDEPIALADDGKLVTLRGGADFDSEIGSSNLSESAVYWLISFIIYILNFIDLFEA